MTRINAHIPPAKLCDQHLVAEYREILRTNALANKRADKEGSKMLSKLPQQFTLGSGHVLFFYDKLEYIRLRFQALRDELVQRGFNVTIDYQPPEKLNHPWLYNNWLGDPAANELVSNRILERAEAMKTITLSGKKLTFEEYKAVLLEKN